jgi:hypothetical protein
VQALNRERLDTIQQQPAQHPLFREDSMNLYQRAACIWNMANGTRRASCWTPQPSACKRMLRAATLCCIYAATCRRPNCNSGNFCVIKLV